ncbi:DotH/IcmK family type IV secretion protein [Salipiger mucosus]|uniref:Type IV secretion protein DotH n=1 Tax=Salipiger mucosus DSM 16094 TaxID=1123237 RepID=S9QV71_9RHOB|nr:DotH/IcmK family type IV secretion protein [Salipiger mucosus]EPX83503.1 hypothetical protein Salmuc_02111 [Salipiger mucosus DSM 16094]
MVAACALATAAHPAFAQSGGGDGDIVIYSEQANPENPISIRNTSGAQGRASQSQVSINAQQTSTGARGDIPESSLSDLPEMTPEEAEAMSEIFKIIEKSNAVDEIQADDPLSGMSPQQRAFIEAMQGVVPMTPDQIRLFKQRYDQTQRAERESVGEDPARTSRSVDLSLKPGEDIPVIRMQPGRVSTITFSDRNGNPWPVLSVTTGDSSAFAAQTAGEQGDTNILVVNPQQDYASSNMVVTLVDNPVPVLLTLEARDEETVDYRTDVRIDGKGPNSNYAITEERGLSPTGDKTMMSFLDGLPPRGAEKMQTSNPGVEAWMFQGKMYVRTHGEVLSPAYVAKSSNVSGVSVFVLQENPILLISQNGEMNSVSARRN